jgi:hypothetical protein
MEPNGQASANSRLAGKFRPGDLARTRREVQEACAALIRTRRESKSRCRRRSSARCPASPRPFAALMVRASLDLALFLRSPLLRSALALPWLCAEPGRCVGSLRSSPFPNGGPRGGDGQHAKAIRFLSPITADEAASFAALYFSGGPVVVKNRSTSRRR